MELKCSNDNDKVLDNNLSESITYSVYFPNMLK